MDPPPGPHACHFRRKRDQMFETPTGGRRLPKPYAAAPQVSPDLPGRHSISRAHPCAFSAPENDRQEVQVADTIRLITALTGRQATDTLREMNAPFDGRPRVLRRQPDIPDILQLRLDEGWVAGQLPRTFFDLRGYCGQRRGCCACCRSRVGQPWSGFPFPANSLATMSAESPRRSRASKKTCDLISVSGDLNRCPFRGGETA